MAKLQRENDLLGAIHRSPIGNKAIEDVETRQHIEPKKTKTGQAKSASGAVQIWMLDDDRRVMREVRAWLSGQGIRPSDSMILRAGLRHAAKDLPGLLGSYREAEMLDGRRAKKA